MKPKLELVHEPPVDITALNRASIEARDWDQVMIAGDKAKSVKLANVRKVRRG